MKYLLKMVFLASLINLLGCSQYNLYSRAAASEGAKAADEALISNKWFLCNAITVGAWMRQFGSDVNKAEAWKTLCQESSMTTPANEI